MISNDTLTNDIVSFEQLGPEFCCVHVHQRFLWSACSFHYLCDILVMNNTSSHKRFLSSYIVRYPKIYMIYLFIAYIVVYAITAVHGVRIH